MQNNKRSRIGIQAIIILVMMAVMFYMFRMAGQNDMKYSELLGKFENQQIDEFELNLGSGKMTYHEAGAAKNEYQIVTVPDVNLFLEDVRDSIAAYNSAHPTAHMTYNYVAASNWGIVLSTYLPIILLIGVMIFFYYSMNQQGGKIGNIGRARTRQGQEDGRRNTFADVAGADEEKEELSEIVEYLKNPAKYNALGAKIPKGVLLVGPPGTGKTLLARAVAGEAGVPFFSISGSDFVELYVGVGASRVRDLFDKAKKARPSIIFIDEIDAVGRQRGAGLGGGNDEREQTLNQLLVELDGFTGNEGVIVMAATNRADILDHAMLRPGRFDRQIYVGYPDVKGREEILKVHARGKPLAPDVNLATIAKSTPGFTGADLENLLNEAALLAARKNRKAITEEDVEEASIKVVAGPEKKSKVVSEKERKLTAYHEAGHAISTYIATPEKQVHQISIMPRGQMGGFTMSLPEDDVNYSTRSEMQNEITTLLGGRVAEALVLDDISTGASSDLTRATDIARSMVTKYGFSDKLGPVVYEEHDEVFIGRDFAAAKSYSEQVAADIDLEVRAIIERSYAACKKILADNRAKLDTLAAALLANERVDGADFLKIMRGEAAEALKKVAAPAAENAAKA
ncbi:MAG: ATP-dependent zinc metalloprotease FtsH [Oscillospiraceae bacterium]|nr:ATP-dependent zinc metalloprotease FtsH [Oscillospiraceae bacterium]